MRVLFVDDEPHVLEALERSLFDCDDDWEIETADGGVEALHRLDTDPFDVVVTDMQMPGMNGTALLEEIQAQHPETVRIVLSGHAQDEETIRVLPFAHRYLSKPCSVDDLVRVIGDTDGLRRLLRHKGLMRFVGSLRTFPSAPRVYRELCDVLERPGVSSAAVVKVVRQDPALAARILHIARSTFFRRGVPPRNLEQAVVRLGTDMLRVLAVAAGVFETAPTAEIPGLTSESLRRDALRTADVARAMATDTREAEAAFIAGLLHDVGLLILLAYAPERLCELPDGGPGDIDVERTVWAATHAEIGAYLLGLWGLPTEIVAAVTFHHEPTRAPERHRALAELVHVADSATRGELPDPTQVDRARIDTLMTRAQEML